VTAETRTYLEARSQTRRHFSFGFDGPLFASLRSSRLKRTSGPR
jgi:hypothetical protein